MSKKPLTRTLATAISVKVREQLRKESRDLHPVVKAKVVASKEWKQYLKLSEMRNDLEGKIATLKQEIVDKYSTPLVKIQVYSNAVSASENHNIISSDSIRDTLLIEEYVAGDSETPEQLIERIVLKIKNG